MEKLLDGILGAIGVMLFLALGIIQVVVQLLIFICMIPVFIVAMIMDGLNAK